MVAVGAVNNMCYVLRYCYCRSLLMSLFREYCNRYAVTVLAVPLLMLSAAVFTEILLLPSMVPSTTFVVPVFSVVAVAVAGAASFGIIAVFIRIAFDGTYRRSGKIDDIVTILCYSLLSCGSVGTWSGIMTCAL